MKAEGRIRKNQIIQSPGKLVLSVELILNGIGSHRSLKQVRYRICLSKIIASGPITSWQIGGETMETVADFISLGSKITADGDCSHEIKTLAP